MLNFMFLFSLSLYYILNNVIAFRSFTLKWNKNKKKLLKKITLTKWGKKQRESLK